MKHVRYLLLLLALVISATAQAQYNPNNPDEPGARPWQLTLKAVPAEAGYFSVNQQTAHAEGEQMRLVAYTYNNYRFVQWEDDKGNVLSTDRNLNYVMPSANVTLVARYEYSPGNPNEPGQASIKRRLTLKSNPEGAGRFNLNSNSDFSAGETVNLWAYSNKNYYFRNWIQDGSVVSSSANFAYTMPDRNVTLVANFDYDYQPDSPNEPGQPSNSYCNIYGIRIDAKAGQTINYPVYLENRGTAVTGFQVDVSLPMGFTTDAKHMSLTDRATGHTLQAEQTSEGLWHIIVSGANAIEGESGPILTLPIHVPDTVTMGQVFTIRLANGIIAKEGGEQQTVNTRDGSLKILDSGGALSDSPDYVVTDLQTTTTEVLPGGNLSIEWQVKNQGNMAGYGGWTERLYLVALDGRKVSIGTTSYETNELRPDASVSRNATITMAQLPGIDGRADIAVTIVPNSNSGEISDLIMNNTTQTEGQPITVGKRLVLTLPSKPQLEGEATNIRCQLARSGNWTQAETFKLTKLKGDNRILIPETVVIPRETASAYFYLTLTNDDKCNVDSIVSLRVEGNSYDAVEGSFIVTDDELMPLSLTASTSEVTEGETFQLTVTLAQPADKLLTVSLTTELPKRFRLPASVVIPAGQTKVTVDVTAVDNEIPDGDVSCAFTAYAAGYEPTEAIVILKDNDLPVLELTLTPNKVKENDGPVSITGTLRRLTNIDKKITVRLSDDSNGSLYFSQKELVLAKGVQQVNFNFGPVDNGKVDGDRQYTITAAVWLSSCSCSASGQAAGNVQAQLQVFDDDGPALTLTSSQATVREGVTTRLTVTRNTGTEQSLTVRLSSDHDDLLTYNHTLVIPAGQQSAYVEVTPAANDTQNDSQTIVFTAESESFSSGTCYVLVTDQTLPDAVITNISVAESEIEVGESVLVSIAICNKGVAALPAQTQANLYIAGSNNILMAFYTQTDILPGDTVTLTKSLTLNSTPGSKILYAVVNEACGIRELNYVNNTSNSISVQVKSPYKAIVAVDKKVYRAGETIHFSGNIEGRQKNDKDIEIFFIENGTRQSLFTTTDSEGNFTCDYTLFEKQIGHFAFGACYPGESEISGQGSFDVIGLLRASHDYIMCQTIVGVPYQGSIRMKNPVAIEQHNIRTEVINGHNNIAVRVAPVSTVAAMSEFDLSFGVEASTVTTEQKWQQVMIRVISDEGTATDITLYCYCRQPNAQLALNIDELNTTITKDSTRDYPIIITNQGAGETGMIQLSLPDHLQTATATELPSLQSGDSLTVVFKLTATADMMIGVPITGKIGINCKNGDGVSLPYSLLPVSSSTGTLVVDVCDEYTYYTDNGSHLSGAKVVVSNPFSGKQLVEGLTGGDGRFEIVLPEGYYQLEVTADKHDPWKNNVIVDPERVTTKVVNLFHDVISVEWTVETTEVEDEYDIRTTVIYETNVPAPVVVTELPDSLIVNDMAPGESVLIYATLTNKGLIAAEDVQLIFPKEEYLTFEPLVNMPFRLMPHQSVTVPIRVTLSPDIKIEEDNAVASKSISTRRSGRYVVSCFWKVITAYYWKCGKDHKWIKYEKIIHSGLHCFGYWREDPEINPNIPNPCSDGYIWLGGSGGGQSTTNNADECMTCKESLKKALTEGFWESLEGIDCLSGTLMCAGRKIFFGNKDVLECEKNGLNPTLTPFF